MNPSIVKRCLVGTVLAIAATLPGFQQLHTSVEGLKLIADYEGCRLQPYQCSAGVWTDGIGNTSGVIPGKTITERQAAEGLISNVLRVERALERCVKQQPPQKCMTQSCRLPSTWERVMPVVPRWLSCSISGAGQTPADSCRAGFM